MAFAHVDSPDSLERRLNDPGNEDDKGQSGPGHDDLVDPWIPSCVDK
jgi:hypothetical protein